MEELMSTQTADRATAPWGHVALNDTVDLRQIGESQFTVLVFERGLSHFIQLRWPTSAESLEPVLPYALATSRTDRSRGAVLDLERVVGHPCLASVVLAREMVWVRMAATEQPALAEAEAWLRGCFAPPRTDEDDETHRVPVSFWSYGSYANEASRGIGVPVWAEIAGNYPRAVRAGLERLYDERFRPDAGGQLVLWHGDPGTGKTYALRSLAWAWRGWCDLHYVTDPETFFGSRPDYMMEVLLDEGDDDERWRLLVLEDTGDLLTAGGGGGQGLSRLLNVVDGIVGQGLRILVLVTTNEPLARLHPAISRPGRCAARIEFAPFGREEAEVWLAERGGPAGAPEHPTLARLYAHLRGAELPDGRAVRPRVGFVR